MKKILLLIMLTIFSYADLPKMSFNKSFYIENKCTMFKYKNKEFSPNDCFYIKEKPFNLDHCIIVDNGVMCVSSENRKNYLLNTNFVIKDKNIILVNKIIEVNEIVYQGNNN